MSATIASYVSAPLGKARRGIILGMDGVTPVTAELANGGGRFAQLVISGNRVR